MFGVEVQRRRRRAEQARGRLRGAGQNEPGEPVGERRLADARRAADQPGVRHPTRNRGTEQNRLRLGMADQLGVGAWWRRRYDETAAHRRPNRVSTAASTSVATASTVRPASMTTQRSGSLRAISRKPPRRRRWKSRSIRSRSEEAQSELQSLMRKSYVY